MEEADIMKNKVNKLISNLYKKREKLMDMDYSTGELAIKKSKQVSSRAQYMPLWPVDGIVKEVHDI